ncbi:MAG: hypothetical protein QM734_07145 [Cyclobacteriaceae bacterium]
MNNVTRQGDKAFSITFTLDGQDLLCT